MVELARADEPGSDLIRFGASFVRSEAFKELFREGMNLVEETAGYLDGAGRAESQRLGRLAALTYASESMRLTTRLMQIASWLLVQRAVAEGEITPDQAGREKTRVRLTERDATPPGATDAERLPPRLRELIFMSLRFHARVVHLDRLISGTEGRADASPLAAERNRLSAAFGA